MEAQNDPYDSSVSDLKQLLGKAKVIQNQSSQKGVVDQTSLRELGSICEEANDLVNLLKEMLNVIEERGGRVHGKVFTANEIIRRQNTFRELQSEFLEVREFYQRVIPRAPVGNREENAVVSDEFVQAQEKEQREESAIQDEILDRLTYGLHELAETGVHIRGELETQDEMLTDLDRDMSTIQVKLRSANEKVEKLLASMSNSGKICTVVGLMVTIFILLFLIF